MGADIYSEPTFTLLVTVQYPAIVTETATLLGLTKAQYDEITANPEAAVPYLAEADAWEDGTDEKTGEYTVIEIEEID